MFRMKKILFALILLAPLAMADVGWGDEADLISFQTQADVLLILDFSGSMRALASGGGALYAPKSAGCQVGPYYPPNHPDVDTDQEKTNFIDCSGADENVVERFIYGETESCQGPFYNTFRSSHNVDCRRVAIAKRAIEPILDKGEAGMGIKLGYMRFIKCSTSFNDDTDPSRTPYNQGCIKLIDGIGSDYSRIQRSIDGEGAPGGRTPLTTTLDEAKLYLDTLGQDICRKRYVLFITDGADTLACDGKNIKDDAATDLKDTQYKRDRALVAKAKAMADAGYNWFWGRHAP